MNKLFKYLLFLIIGIIICLLLNNYEKFVCDDPFKDKIDNKQSDPIFLRNNTTAFSGAGSTALPQECNYFGTNHLDNANCTVQCNLGDNDNAPWKKKYGETDKTITCNTASTYILAGHGEWIEDYTEDFFVPHNLQLFTYLFTCLLNYTNMSEHISFHKDTIMLDHNICTNNLPGMYLLMTEVLSTMEKEDFMIDRLRNLIYNIMYYIQKKLSSNLLCSTFISPPPPPVDETLKYFKNYGKPITKGERFYNIILASDFQAYERNFYWMPYLYKYYVDSSTSDHPLTNQELAELVGTIRTPLLQNFEYSREDLRQILIRTGGLPSLWMIGGGGPFGSEHDGIKQCNLYETSNIMDPHVNQPYHLAGASSLSYFVKTPFVQKIKDGINFSYPSSYTITLSSDIIIYIKQIWHKNFNSLDSDDKYTTQSKFLVNVFQKYNLSNFWNQRLDNFNEPQLIIRKEWNNVNIDTFPLLSLNCLLDNIYRNPIPDYDAIDSELLRDIFNIIVTAIIYGTSENPNPIYNIFKE